MSGSSPSSDTMCVERVNNPEWKFSTFRQNVRLITTICSSFVERVENPELMFSIFRPNVRLITDRRSCFVERIENPAFLDPKHIVHAAYGNKRSITPTLVRVTLEIILFFYKIVFF